MHPDKMDGTENTAVITPGPSPFITVYYKAASPYAPLFLPVPIIMGGWGVGASS